MHLIFYSPQSLPSIGGLQYVVHYWAVELALRGHTITILTDTDEYESGTPIPALPDGVKYLRKAGWWKQVRMMRNASRVVMFNISLKGLPLWVLAKALGGPKLFASHHTALWYDGGAKPIRQRLKQWAANRIATANCACSGYIANLYKNCGVIFSPYQSDIFCRGRVPRLPNSILFVGRLVSDKGVDILLSAFHRLHYKMRDITLSIAGDGPEIEDLQAAANKMFGKENNPVTFYGSLPQPEIIRLMHTHQIMVVPSRMEPMGMVVAEGLSCGCQMVVSNQGGMPEVGDNFCRYFQSDNVMSLATVLQQELTNPLSVDPKALDTHLRQFTVRYSVDRLLYAFLNEIDS